MNSMGQPLKLKANYKVLGILGALGLVVFFIINFVMPAINVSSTELQSVKMISKEQATQTATQFAQSQLSNDIFNHSDTIVTYQSNSDLYGYLSKNKLIKDYTTKFEASYPYDVFRVRLAEADTYLNVDVHMNTGKVVAFSYESIGSRQLEVQTMDETLNLESRYKLTEPWLEQWGYTSAKLKLTKNDKSGLIYTDPNTKIGDSTLQFKFTFDMNTISSFEPSFSVPADHVAYVKKETMTALWLTILGYGLLTLVLGILAIIYSALTHTHTSFLRGIFLSVFYFAVSMLSTYNMIPALKAEGGTTGDITFTLVSTGIISFFMAALLYFSLVGGNGLWRKEAGLNPWPRAKEPGYGSYVLNSMYVGYLWAFILLGVQSVIFLVLEHTLHTWSTTDSSQSPYNMLYPWTFPLLAWLAGISEEAIYRLFGIKMMKKIVKNTFIACLIPTIIWALGHTLYPIYPVVSRPIELLVIGLIFSFIFLRYGFIAALFSHVIFDSILMGFSLFALGDTANVSAGIVSMIMPVIVAYVIYVFNSKKKEKPYVTTPPEVLQ
ncbi:hypothetical protein J2T13_001596 [Paenibacillus sp. DS2015]|uniref:CPBP family intramembrane glutamic endopeptidase n=1 Tax=Paenibacillus sp. DS2015 TaxID=3373917 RepID=UPI003D19CF7A